MKEITKTKLQSGSLKLLRWILLLPAATLSALIITFPLHWVLYWSLSGGPDPFISPYPQIPEKILQPMISAIAFVFVSGVLAPKANITVSKIAAGVWCIGLILAVFIVQKQGMPIMQILQDNYYGVPILSGILGVGIGISAIKKKSKTR